MSRINHEFLKRERQTNLFFRATFALILIWAVVALSMVGFGIWIIFKLLAFFGVL